MKTGAVATCPALSTAEIITLVAISEARFSALISHDHFLSSPISEAFIVAKVVAPSLISTCFSPISSSAVPETIIPSFV